MVKRHRRDVTTFCSGILGFIMRSAPIGAFGAMSFTVGEFGIVTLLSLRAAG